ncbi:MAG: hypothetical protein HXS48_19480 [Theionarchaea archaeon]|nr:hypothetical protein [Theionarchaea archaeon]
MEVKSVQTLKHKQEFNIRGVVLSTLQGRRIERAVISVLTISSNNLLLLNYE